MRTSTTCWERVIAFLLNKWQMISGKYTSFEGKKVMNDKNKEKSIESVKGFWSLRSVLTDIGAGFLVYIMIMIIIIASKAAPSGFVYVAF